MKTPTKIGQNLAACLIICVVANSSLAHDGPTPIGSWDLGRQADVRDINRVIAKRGSDGTLLGRDGKPATQAATIDERGLLLSGQRSGVEITSDHQTTLDALPHKNLTATAWVSVLKPLPYGCVIGVIEDDGPRETGWLLGYNETSFVFALRGGGGDDRLTYLAGKTKYVPGQMYHLAAVYDGSTMQLFVNGKLDAASDAESGDIVYPSSTPFSLGAYRDTNEFWGHHGRLKQIRLYDQAARLVWVQHEFNHDQRLANLRPEQDTSSPRFVVKPYLQYATQTQMTVMWRTNRPSTATLCFGETSQCKKQIEVDADEPIGSVVLDRLKPETQYFYRVKLPSTEDNMGVESPLGTFQTAVRTETPFAFVVIGDTQGNPVVSAKLADFAWQQRPSFLMHAGDLVTTGRIDAHWTEHFFPGLESLIRHVPFYPVLGNHEQNAKNYFDYVSLPSPEYYYQFTFGNTDFFMIDSNRNVDPDSEQFKWLDSHLQASSAAWKFVCFHQPPYSSDANDYGDLWKTNQGTRGDTRVRELVPLFEKHGVDVIWNGHIHSYERTWPIRDGRAVEQDGPIYMITGGGGGSLESSGPVRPFFMNTVREGHHYSMVRINGSTLEIQAYDLENRLFDQLRLHKSE